MSKIAAELERIGFRTPTVFQSARQRFGAAGRRMAGSPPPVEEVMNHSAVPVLPQDLTVQSSEEKVQNYLGIVTKPGKSEVFSLVEDNLLLHLELLQY